MSARVGKGADHGDYLSLQLEQRRAHAAMVPDDTRGHGAEDIAGRAPSWWPAPLPGLRAGRGNRMRRRTVCAEARVGKCASRLCAGARWA